MTDPRRTTDLDDLPTDPFDEKTNPPIRVEKYQTADPRLAERWIKHIYADGRQQGWISRYRGPWERWVTRRGVWERVDADR